MQHTLMLDQFAVCAPWCTALVLFATVATTACLQQCENVPYCAHLFTHDAADNYVFDEHMIHHISITNAVQ
jgi:hypothetical protein